MAYHILGYDNKRLIAEIMLINYYVCIMIWGAESTNEWVFTDLEQIKRFITLTKYLEAYL